MSHDHNHTHHHQTTDQISVAFFLNLSFTFIEIIGGILTNSVAILSDALHDLGDSLSLGLAWYFQRLSQQGRNQVYTFGYKRFNTLGALINGIVLVAGSLIILYEAVPRLLNPQATHVPGMIGLAVLGVLVNGAAVLRLRRGGGSLNEEMITWHLLEDVLGWLAVLVGSLIMYFFDAPIVDPILSIVITLYVLINVIKRLRKSIKVILQAKPEGIDLEEVEQAMMGIEEVKSVHHTHVWTLDGDYHILSTHIKIDGRLSVRELAPIKEELRRRLEDLHIEHATIEFEDVEEKGVEHVD